MTMNSIEYPDIEQSEKGEPLFRGNMDLIKNAEVELEVVVGSKKITISELYKLKIGSTLALNQRLNEPVVLMLNGSPIARGELVAVDDSFGIRITDIDQ